MPEHVRDSKDPSQALRGPDDDGDSDGMEEGLEFLGSGPAAVLRVLDSMLVAFFHLDRQWQFVFVNAEAVRVLGQPRDQLVGRTLWEMFPATVEGQVETEYRAALTSGEPRTFETFYPAPLNAWYEIRALPGADGLAVYFVDVTARKAAQRVAEEAAERSALLAQVSAELSTTLESQVAVGRLARLVVPALADWCLVSLVADTAPGQPVRLREVGGWHVDEHARPLLARYAQVRQAAMTEESFVVQAVRTGRVQIVPVDVPAWVRQVVSPGEAQELLAELAPAAGAVFPMLAGERTVGVLTLYNSAARGRFTAQDIDTATEVAARASTALHNAHLFAQQRRLSEGLQRSMLTEPPQPDHLQIVVRYEPAAQEAQVGGDWYDAFLQPDGATMVVIGDVIGHDTAAAAAMGQLRALLRGIAARHNEGPAQVLAGVDQVMQTLQVDTTASVIVARLEQTEDERERGVTRMRWSNAGHPPPMVINPDGSILVLPELEADLLLGIDPNSERGESVLTLDRGATVLLYTDGLVERRGQSLDDGIAQLQHTLLQVADRSLDRLCDEVLARMLPEQPEDDVAIVAVRLHRQDRERPAEAGPNRLPPNVPAPH